MNAKAATTLEQAAKPQTTLNPSSFQDSASTEAVSVTKCNKVASNGLSIEELLTPLPNSWDIFKEKVERITRRYIECCNESLDKIDRPDFYYSFEIEESLEQWESVALDLRQMMNKITKLQLYEPDNDSYQILLQALTTMILQWKAVRDSLANSIPSTSISEE